MMKKLLSSLLAVLLILGCCTVALAAETGTGLDVKLLNSTADQVTLGVYVAQETAMKNSRVVLEYPEAMTLENAVSKLPKEAGITDLRTSEPGKVSFAWASYEAQNGTELFEVTLRIQDTEQPALPLTISLPEQGRSETLLITIPYTFRDVADDTVWYYPYVYAAYYAGLMNGVGDDLFDPNGILTRGAMATILYRMAGTPQVTGSSPFSDVASGRYYTGCRHLGRPEQGGQRLWQRYLRPCQPRHQRTGRYHDDPLRGLHRHRARDRAGRDFLR